MNFTRLKKLLAKILHDDQYYRHSIIKEKSQKKVKKIWSIIRKKDKHNKRRIECILKRYPNLALFNSHYELEELLYEALFLVIQHSSLEFQEKHLPLMTKAVEDEKIEPSSFALLVDRILVNKGKKQIYGTQVGKDITKGAWFVFEIADESNVNKRREEVDLEPLEEYLSYWGIDYKIHS